jgi:hypothetical protein
MGIQLRNRVGDKNALAGGRFNPAPALLLYTYFPEMMTLIA